MGEGEWEMQASRYGKISHWNKYYKGNIVKDIVIALDGDRWQLDGSYICEPSITYKLVKSLFCTLETNLTFCVNYTQKKKKKKKRH